MSKSVPASFSLPINVVLLLCGYIQLEGQLSWKKLALLTHLAGSADCCLRRLSSPSVGLHSALAR